MGRPAKVARQLPNSHTKKSSLATRWNRGAPLKLLMILTLKWVNVLKMCWNVHKILIKWCQRKRSFHPRNCGCQIEYSIWGISIPQNIMYCGLTVECCYFNNSLKSKNDDIFSFRFLLIYLSVIKLLFWDDVYHISYYLMWWHLNVNTGRLSVASIGWHAGWSADVYFRCYKHSETDTKWPPFLQPTIFN